MADPMMDFWFGFNDAVFSDRVLHIEIIDDSLDSHGDCTRKRKNCNENDSTKGNVIDDSLDSHGDCTSNKKKSNGNDATKNNVVEVKTLHVSSLVLAASSPFFYKLFKNGMKESQERDLTLRINASEDSSLMDILKFMYCNTLNATTVPNLLGVLIVADKFEVTSCMRYCIRLLQNVPMSLESALSYLQLPSSVLLAEVVQPLIVATKEYLVASYSDFNKFRKEVMDLPLCAVEVILSTNRLQVDSEDDVFDFILEWASLHYPKLEERRKILTEQLLHCISFHNMSCSRLKEVLVCPEFGHEQVSKLVLEALFLKAEFPYTNGFHGSKELATTNGTSLVRIYKYLPVKVVQLEFLKPHYVVYFEIRKEECEYLFKSPRLYSQSFSIGGRCFYLSVKPRTVQQQNSFDLYFQMAKESESCTLDYEFAVINNSSKQFQLITQGKSSNSELLSFFGYHPYRSNTEFTRLDSKYFTDGILHLRADLTINSLRA